MKSSGPEGLHTLPKSSVTESMVLHPGILWFANKGTPVATCSDSSQAVINQEGARSSGMVAICIDSTGSQPEGRLMMGLEGFHLHLPCLTALQESKSSGVSTASKLRIPGKQKSLAVFAYKTIR